MNLKRTIPVILAGTAIAALSSGAYAGQKYTIGMSTDVTTSTSGPASGAPGTGNSYAGSYGSYPSLDFNAHGRHSSFDTTYAFGINRNFSGSSGTSKSHSATSRFSSPIGPKWSINLSDSFEQTTDSSTFKLLRGDTSVSEDFRFIFDPVFSSSRRTNTASFGLSRKLTQRSSLTFGGSYSLLMYVHATQLGVPLSNQQRMSVNASYTHSLAHGSWNFGYSGSQFAFDAFQRSRAHSLSLGYSRQISKSASLQLSGGASYVQTPEAIKHPVGSNASVGLQRTIKDGGLSVVYSQSSADTSGFGSIAGSQQLALGMSHTLGRKMTVSADGAGFYTRGKAIGSASNHGGSVGGSMGFFIGRRLTMNGGAQYQRYSGSSQFALDQKRIFVSLRFHNPEFWRF